jgi:hypothetical protein
MAPQRYHCIFILHIAALRNMRPPALSHRFAQQGGGGKHSKSVRASSALRGLPCAAFARHLRLRVHAPQSHPPPDTPPH